MYHGEIIKEYPRYHAVVTRKCPERPENWKPLRWKEAEDVFNEMAVYCGNAKGVPMADAFRLFGWRIMEHVIETAHSITDYQETCRFWLDGGIWEGKRLNLLKLRGFYKAVTLANIETLSVDQEEEDKAWGADVEEIDRREQERWEAEEAAKKEAQRQRRKQRAQEKKAQAQATA